MNLAMLLNTIDAMEHITIINHNSRNIPYIGLKYKVNNIDYNSEVFAVYTVNGKITIEVC